MKSKSKKILKEILTDPRHWFGWLLTTGAVIGVFHLLGVHLHTWLYSSVLFGTIIIVDSFKHIWGFQ